MNPIIIIIAVLFVILMVAFGRNPINEAREKHAAGLAGKDPLIEAIEEHNKLQGHFGMPEGFTPYPAGNAAGSGAGMVNTPGFPAYMQRSRNPYAAANPYRTPGTPEPVQPPPPPAQNSYYPPPPVPNSSLPPRSDAGMDKIMPYLNLPGRSPMYVAGGQRISFIGTSAYALDDKGWPRPMPDGKYAMYDGRVTITIRRGHKVAD